MGWTGKLSVPQLVMDLDKNNAGNLEILRQSAPVNCFMVFIGGKYVSRLDDIVRKVDEVTDQLATKPTIYFAEKSDEAPSTNLKDIFLVMIGL